MKKKRMLVATAAVALTLGLGAGIAAAQTDPAAPRRPQASAPHDGDMDARHEEMREQMPAEMQAQCNTMHAQGSMPGSGMMNGGMGSQAMGGMTSGG